MLEDQSKEEGDPDLDLEYDFVFLDDREKHWKDVVVENNGEKKRVHSLRWEIHIKYKEELKNRYFPVVVTNLKGGIIIWTCGKDNIIGEN